MTTTYRWYTFASKDDQASVYEIVGWSRTKEAALAKRDKIDAAGRSGINIFSPSRQQAMADLMEVYDGAVVEGYISPENKRAGRQIVKAAVMREMFCPYTGVILDMRRAVVVSTPSKMFVCAATHWDKVAQGLADAGKTITELAPDTTVYDGRELFK